ncbi:LacI family transcriptional regulator [Paenibacillus albidus]|uniref:LacI family transcriptional regulator n=1 Tax=Paenibacillus albidus TaxID=2041023 RepID=A0A917FB19_9BACL|nr:ABC transporter substrate-binding protein [Paenibacillus albidus]GGF60903.1 LacI family transcriptional regulator [Paenibacillus albidus]
MILILLLAGCWSGDNGPVKTSSSPSVPPDVLLKSEIPVVPPPSKSYVLGFSQLGSESTWREANTSSIVEAAEEAGISLMMRNAEQSQKKQFEAIRFFIRNNVDVIAIAPVVQYGWEPILKEVKQAGIPVIILDRSVNVKDSSLYVTFIGSDFYEEGVKAAKYMLDKMRHRTGTVKIAELQGTVGSTPSIDRGRGFRETIGTAPDFQVSLSQVADFTVAKGRKVMSQFLELPREEWPQVLFSHNDDMAIGAVEAIEEAGLRPGEDLVIISIDGTRRAFEQMKEGKINAVVECNPLLGPLLMQATNEIMAGRTLPKQMVPEEDIFTQEIASDEVEKRKY